jgi:signal transduction histidine kinase
VVATAALYRAIGGRYVLGVALQQSGVPSVAVQAGAQTHWFLSGGGEAGRTARSVDWAATSLGPPERWPTTLKTTVATMFRARQPMFLWWGKDLIQIYNDEYLPSFGEGKHPCAMGQHGRECWQEIWPIIGPQIDDVMERAIGSWNEDALVPIFRNRKIEEVYWTYTYSPVFGEDGAVAGTLVICTETTNRVLGERRTSLLHALVGKTSIALDHAALVAATFEVLRGDPGDIPFAVLYDRDAATDQLTIAASVGISGADADSLGARLWAPRANEDRVEAGNDENWLVSTGMVAVDRAVAGAGTIEAGYVMPLPASRGGARSYLLVGLSPALPFDAAYRRFLEQVAGYLRVARTRVEEAERRAAAELEGKRLVAQRESLLADLEVANRAKDEFLAMLGHELRNPLSPIVTALRLMREKSEPRVPREQEIIERQVDHLMRLVDDLLDVARIARGKVELRREVVDVADVVTKAAEIAGDLLERRHHRLEIACDRERYWCNADPVRLSQVVANLLTNAAKYTNPGGAISLTVSGDDDEVILAVRDNGIGISAELLPRVFDIFEQGQRPAGGLGIGLALVKNLTALHGGKVTATSAGPGDGSEFAIRLPRAQGHPAPRPARPSPSGHATSSTRVLVVDDNVDGAELLKEWLELHGHEVETANDAMSGLDVAAHFHPQVALLDIGLPVVDGYELATRLRLLPGAADCRLIALTGYGQEQDRRRSHEAKFEAHLIKPVDLNHLVASIEAPRRG